MQASVAVPVRLHEGRGLPQAHAEQVACHAMRRLLQLQVKIPQTHEADGDASDD